MKENFEKLFKDDSEKCDVFGKTCKLQIFRYVDGNKTGNEEYKMSREHSPSVVLIQADTRLTDADGGHLQITMPVNKKVCKHLNYEYRFVHIDEKLISCCVRSHKLENKTQTEKVGMRKYFL